jgi:hypothetical protein
MKHFDEDCEKDKAKKAKPKFIDKLENLNEKIASYK